MNPPKPKRKESAADQAYAMIRADIVSGKLSGSDRLTEAGLSESLSMSRTPVREAVKRLLLEGRLTRDVGPGLRVASMTPAEIEEVFQIRMLLECHACKCAATHASEEEIEQLSAMAQDMLNFIPPKSVADYQAISELNSQFHQLILQAANSARLSAMLSATVDMALVLRTFRQYSDVEISRSASHHREIADAISARSPEWASAAMATHILAAATVSLKQSED